MSAIDISTKVWMETWDADGCVVDIKDNGRVSHDVAVILPDDDAHTGYARAKLAIQAPKMARLLLMALETGNQTYEESTCSFCGGPWDSRSILVGSDPSENFKHTNDCDLVQTLREAGVIE